MRHWLRLAVVCLLLSAGSALARPYTIDDLLKTEDLGQVGFDPTGRWLVIERRGPYDTAPRFDYEDSNRYQLGRLLVLEVSGGKTAMPLFAAEPGVGYAAGPFAPDGAHLAVFRLRDRRWEVGIAAPATRTVRWLGLTPEFTLHGRAAQWRSARELVLIARADGSLPAKLREGWEPAEAMTRRRSLAAFGGVSASINASGRFSDRAVASDIRTLLKIDVISGVVTRLATGAFEDLEVSPTGRFAAATVIVGDRSPLEGEVFRGAGGLLRHGLRVIDLENGKASSPCPDADLGVLLMSWSQTTDELLVLARLVAQGSMPRLIRVPARRGDAAPLELDGIEAVISNAWGVPSAATGWLGDDPIVLARPDKSGSRADWYRVTGAGAVKLTAALPVAPNLPVALGDRGLLFVTGTIGVWADRRGRLSAPIANLVVASTPSPPLGTGLRALLATPSWGLSTVFTRGRGSGGLGIDSPPETMDILAATSAGIVVKSRTLPGETEVRLVRRGGAQTVVARLNAHLRGVDLAKVVELRHAAPDGTPVKSWLYLPPDPGPSPPLPLVVIPYAGAVYLRPPSQMAGDVLNLTPNAQVLAGQGYAVLVPSLPRAKTTGEPAEGLGLQIEQAIDSALATGRIDPERIAVWGHSFGGYTALVMATQSVRIRSVIVSAGISDLTGVWAGFSAQQAATPEPGQALVGAGWAENGQAGLGLPPWRTPDRYVRNSPLYKADQVHAPILLLHGDLDSVPLGQAQAMFTALQRQGKDAVLVTYAGEGHVISSPGNLRDMYAKVLDWLAATLPPPRQGQTPAGRPAPPTSAAKLRWRPRQGNRRIRHAR